MRAKHTKEEFALLERCDSPEAVQRYLDSLTLYKKGRYIARSFRRTVTEGRALCLCAALTAAHMLEYHGYKPLLMDLQIFNRRVDHVIAMYGNKNFGAIGKSTFREAEGRPPIFGSESELARSYAEECRRIGWEVKRFGVIDLNRMRIDWRFETRNLDGLGICEAIDEFPHYTIR